MVQYVGTIEPNLNLLAFCNFELLAQAGIRAPAARSGDGHLSQRSPFAGRWVLQNNLARCVCNGLQRASIGNSGPDVESHLVRGIQNSAGSARRIGDDLIGSRLAEERRSCGLCSDVLTPQGTAAIDI